MNVLSRRDCLKLLLGGLAQTAGTVVLAHAVLPASAAQGLTTTSGQDLVERADQVAKAQAAACLEEGKDLCTSLPSEFVNGAFRNAAFANGGFHNAGFNNAAFHNGGFTNGGFKNAAWRN